MAEQLGEKTEEPTSKRLSDARQKGQIPKSSDLAAFIVMSGGTLCVVLMGGVIIRELTQLTGFVLSPEILGTDLIAGRVVADHQGLLERLAFSLGLFMLIMAFIGGVGQFLQTGPVLSSRAVGFKPEKLNPIQGFKRLFSKRSLVKGGLDVGKLVLIGSVAAIHLNMRWDEVLGVGTLPLMEALDVSLELLIEMAIWVLVVMLVLGLIDLIYQRWQHKSDLKMTKQEVKDERKSSDGDMESKARRLRMAREIAMQRLGTDVPQADVVVTNPTHYAVALRYDRDQMHAPRVIAKGADYLALRIRQLATASGVPIVERPALARALYARVRVGQEIDTEHYEAVAEVLAYVYRLDRSGAALERAGLPVGAE